MNLKEINLSDYKLARPESIKKESEVKKFYDIEVEDDHTFHVVGENDLVLSHNCDGSSIAGLLINFLFKFWPELFENEMVYKVETPIVVSKNNKTKKKIYFYTQNEYNKWLENINTKEWELEYKKGLAALLDDEYQDIIQRPILTKIKTDELSKSHLSVWFGKETDLRKIEILK